MSDDDALEPDMHPLLGSLEAGPSAADQDILERLLEGRVDAALAPPGYSGLARLLAAMTAPAAPNELAGEQQTMAEFAAVMRSTPPTLVPRRSAVPTKVFTMKAAAAALVAVLSIGGIAAAASGLLPGQASSVADKAAASTAATAGQGLGAATSVELDAAAQAGLCRAWQAGQGADHGSPADTPAFQALAAAAGGAGNVTSYCENLSAGGSADGQGAGSAVGPDASRAARAGLCRAWQADQGSGHGRRMDAVAFQALAEAAGGADQVAGYCEDVSAGSAGADNQGKASPPSVSAPSTSVSPPSSGPPADPGPPASTGPGGHGQGGPPTTTG